MSRRLAMLQLFGHREPRLLVTGQTISMFGDGVANVALTLLVLDTTHSVAKLAWFATARMTPLVLLLLVGGAIVDRHARRTLLLISDLARGALTGGLVVLLATGTLRFWQLLVFAVLFGSFDAIFTPAMSAMTPEIVPEHLLGAMNAVRPLSSNVVGGMIGPAVGGLVAAWSTTAAMAIDTATFVASAVALVLMRPTPTPTRVAASTMVHEIKEGLGYVRTTSWIWTTLTAVTLGNALLFTPMNVLIPFFLRHDLHAAKVTVGYFFAAYGLAGGIGALVSGSLAIPRRRIRAMWIAWTAANGVLLIFGIVTRTWEVFLIPLVTAPGILYGNVVWESMLQAVVPRELLGRVSSVDWFVSLGLAPVGLVFAGYVSSLVGVRTYFVGAAIVSTVPGLIILASRRINAVDAGR
ncbi:MAG: MFS transporter [Acidimicrobiales bacterium]